MTLQPTTESRSKTMRLLALLLAALLTPLALTGASLAPSVKPATTTWTVQVGNQSRDEAIQGMRYLPKNIWIDAGDTVHWKANSAEIHTVTFLKQGQTIESTQPFNPADPQQTTRQGGSTYDGTSYYNSGVLGSSGSPGFGLKILRDYSLTFPNKGDFDYYCLVHGKVMKGTVHVREAGTPYPFTQAQYDRQSAKVGAAIIANGLQLWRDTAKRATNHRVFEGNDNGVSMVMRFIRPTVFIKVHERVTWKNIGMGAPHTVTFGNEPMDVTKPVGDPTHYRGGDLNSGLQAPGSHFTVRFDKAGTYRYICALHDYMGMVGKVVVVDR